MRLAKPAGTALLFACVLFAHGAGAAGPEERGRADALFKEGLRLFETGQTSKACGRFDESYRLDPALGTLQNLALCHEKEGKFLLAYDEFTELSSKAAAAGKTARVDVAREHLAALDGKVARVSLKFDDDVHVTGVEVDSAARDWRAPIALEAGHHVITAHAEGRPDARLEYEASDGGGKALSVPFPSVSTPAAVAPLPSPAPAVEPESGGGGAGPTKVPLYVAAGVGAAGVVVGSVFGILTFTQKAAGDRHCAGVYCDPSGLSSENAAHTSATLSTVGFAVGVAALGTCAVLLLTQRSAPAPSKSEAVPRLVFSF
jgi:hypothetical protein